MKISEFRKLIREEVRKVVASEAFGGPPLKRNSIGRLESLEIANAITSHPLYAKYKPKKQQYDDPNRFESLPIPTAELLKMLPSRFANRIKAGELTIPDMTYAMHASVDLIDGTYEDDGPNSGKSYSLVRNN